MPSADLSAVVAAGGPFTSITFGASTPDPSGVLSRWRRLAGDLLHGGAPVALVERLGETVTVPADHDARRTRVVVADGAGDVVLDVELPGAPEREHAVRSPVPVLTAVSRAWARFVPHLLVRLDRTGGTIEAVTSPATGARQTTYVDVAGAGAACLDRLHRQHEVEVILVAGDDRVWDDLRRRTGTPVAHRLVRVHHEAHGNGVPLEVSTGAALEEHRAARRWRVLERLHDRLADGPGTNAVDGLDAVVDALRADRVSHLVLDDERSRDRMLWAAAQPRALALSLESARATGGDHAVQVEADVALLWAHAASDAELVLVEGDDLHLRDGVGAVLHVAREDDVTS